MFKPARVSFVLVTITIASFLFITGTDWPQWRGPDRSGKSNETGLLDEWPEAGPPIVWQFNNLGKGYGSLAVIDGRIFVQGTRSDGESCVFALNEEDGIVLWVRSLGPALEQNRGGGPRGTPTVDGDVLYALTERGDLAALKTSDGTIIWQRNILQDFGGSNPNWLISESPLVDGDRLIVMPGGPDAGIVALNKKTGETIWTSKGLDDQASYSSCLAVDVGDVRTILAFTSNAAVGIRASDGEVMWTYRPVSNRTANITTPVFHNNEVFFTSAYNTGAALLKLTPQGNSVTAEEVYFTREMQNHHGGVVRLGEYIYGFSSSILTCLKWDTGERVWRDRSVGKGSLTYADGHLYLLSEGNVVGLAEATPEGYREKGRFSIEDQGWPSWAHPVVANGRLYIRNQEQLTAYNVSQ